jgi:LmbE family N-acetylglucosaminyl deacetylase
MFGRRILIFVARPGDEVAACAAAIGRAKAQGAEIFAFYLTHGCHARQDAEAARRRAEAEAAAARLGLTPLGWAARAAQHIWRELPEAHAQMRSAIAQCGPDQIWLPAYEGASSDRDALNALGQLLVDQFAILEFAEVKFYGGSARAHQFPFPDGSEQTIELDAVEREQKRRSQALYPSDAHNLAHVSLASESCRPLAVYDYSQPPHTGRLWYARHRWDPFHRSRADFTKPGQVCAAIVGYFEDWWRGPAALS